jgi:hypothetical protein
VTHGFRRIPDQGPWPLDPESFNLFLFGGSTAFGFNIKDDETIAAYLQQTLNKKYKNHKISVYNFGQSGYYSTQERILFERLLAHGNIPHAAIFLDGLNDFFNREDTPFFVNNSYSEILDKHFMLRFLDRLNKYFNPINNIREHLEKFERYKLSPHTKRYYWDNPKEREKKFNDRPILEKVIKTFLNNASIAEATGKSFGVKVGFFWQPIPHYNGDKKYLPFYGLLSERHLYSEFGYKLFRKKIDSGLVKLPSRFGWLADIQKETEGFLYVDAVHYSPEISKAIAQYISEYLVSWNVLPSNLDE